MNKNKAVRYYRE